MNSPFDIPHNTPCLRPPRPQKKNLHNFCFQFPLGITVVSRETEENAYAKFWELLGAIWLLVEMKKRIGQFWPNMSILKRYLADAMRYGGQFKMGLTGLRD